jgi:multimeric flavodoxin WrbA
MKKLLAIMGSPRINGNTHILLSKILDSAENAGAQTQIILLSQLNIRECDGCHACWQGKQCSKADDMNDTYPTIANSDIIIFATPVYWYGPTALIKAFLDRFVFFNCPQNRPLVKGKPAALAIPFEEDNPQMADLTISMFQKSLDYLQMNLAHTIIAPGVAHKGDILNKPDILQQAQQLGSKLALS